MRGRITKCFVGERGGAPNGNKTFLDADYTGVASNSALFCNGDFQPKTAIGILFERFR